MRFFAKVAMFLVLVMFAFAAPSHADYISEITEIAFPSAVLHSDSPVLVVFYSGSFRGKFAKMVDDFARRKSPVRILKMEKGINTLTVAKYRIKRNNTFVFFADGEEIQRTTSIKNSDDLKEFIDFCVKEYNRKIEEETKNEWVPGRLKEAGEDKKDGKD